MPSQKTSNQIYQELKNTCKTELLEELLEDLLEKAIRYANIRSEWSLQTAEECQKLDQIRTSAHNVFIDSCNILARNMDKAGKDISWRAKIGKHRKEIGDFACYLHCILAISAR
ncbi:MAG: hypothetical protein ACOCUT_01325 [bacterium]